MQYEDMQEKFKGQIKSATEHELWNHWVAKDEDYRLWKAIALLGWAVALVAPLGIFFK